MENPIIASALLCLGGCTSGTDQGELWVWIGLGIVALLIGVFIWSRLPRSPRRWLQHVREAIGPERDRRADRASRELTNRLDLAEARIGRNEQEYDDLKANGAPGFRPGDDVRRDRARNKSWALFGLDIPLQALQVWTLGLMLSLPWLLTAATALAAAVGFAPAWALGTWSRWDLGDATIRRSKLAGRLAGIAFVVAGIAAVIIVRSQADWLATAGTALIAICLAEGLAVAGASCAVIADVYDRPHELLKAITRDREEVTEIKNVLVLINRKGDSPPPGGAGLLPALLLMAVICPGLAYGQEQLGHRPSSPPATCFRLLDGTTSVDRIAYAALHDAAGTYLQEAAETGGCDRLGVAKFSSDTVFLTLRWFDALAPNDSGCAQPSLGIFEPFPQIRERSRARAAERCQQQQAMNAEARSVRWLQIADSIAGLPEAPLPRGRGEPTAIADIIHFAIGQHPRLVLIETDGVETASQSISQITIPEGTTVVMILLPSVDTEGGASAAAKAGAAWAKRVPGLVVLPFSRVTQPGIWRQIIPSSLEREPRSSPATKASMPRRRTPSTM